MRGFFLGSVLVGTRFKSHVDFMSRFAQLSAWYMSFRTRTSGISATIHKTLIIMNREAACPQ